MCGIVGLVPRDRAAVPALVPLLEQMRDALAHRGPDGAGTWHDDTLLFGHRRLSVIDLAGGAQPMADNAGRVITFNGEIYNFVELREELAARDYVFHTHSDTEVLLAAYDAWGDAMLDRLNGMFAFALWEPRRRRLLMARDRMGEKPFYWHHGPFGFAFASEMKAILPLPGLATAAEIDPEALSDFLSLGYILTPRTILSQIRRLPAGHRAVFEPDTGRLDIRPYWSLATHVVAEKRPWDDNARRDFRELLDDAVRIRLRSDVPLGAFLSGGLDSTAVVETMSRLVPANVHALCVGFGTKSFDESEGARTVAKALGVGLDVLRYEDGAPNLGRLVWQHDEPFADTSLVPTAQLCRAARARLTVALSGDGADELLAGYPTHAANQAYRAYARVPAPLQAGLDKLASAVLRPSYRKLSLDYKLRRFLGARGLSPERAHAWWRVVFPDANKAHLLVQPCDAPTRAFDDHFRAVAGTDFLSASLYVDAVTWLQDDILVKVDRASMAVGLEVRTPFLDHRLVEFCAHLAPEAKMAGRRQKVALREAMAGRVPPAVLRRPKRGFNAPVRDLGALDLPQAADFPGLLHPGFRLNAQTEDVTFKAFSLRILGIWLEMFQSYKKNGRWEPMNS